MARPAAPMRHVSQAQPPIVATGSVRHSCQCSRALGCDRFQFLFARKRQPGCAQPVNMTWWQAWTFRLLPARFQQALLTQAHEQRIQSARFQACFLREIISVPPCSGSLQQGGQQSAGLAGVIRFPRHGLIINICRVLSRLHPAGVGETTTSRGNHADASDGIDAPVRSATWLLRYSCALFVTVATAPSRICAGPAAAARPQTRCRACRPCRTPVRCPLSWMGCRPGRE